MDVSSIVGGVLALAREHPSWIAGIVFLIAFLEAVAVIGLFVPGTPILLAAGAVAVASGTPLWPIVLAGALGATLGDELSFALGRRGGARLPSVWPLSRHPEWLAHGEAYFARHGVMSVAIGRFLPVVRPMIPLVAGAMRLAPWRFHVVNVLSALVWSPAYVLSGALLGVSAATLGAVSGRLLIALVLVIVAAVGTGGLFRWLWARLVPALGRRRDLAAAWARDRPGRGAALVRAALDPGRSDLRLLALSSALMTILLGAAAWLVEAVAGRGAIVQADSAISNLVQGLRTPGADVVMRVATLLGEWPVVTGVTVLVALWLVHRRAPHLAVGFVTTMAVSAVLVPTIKSVLRVARPSDIYAGVDAFSFPSGHATSAATLYGLLAWIVGRALPARWRIYPALIAGTLVAFVALSRVYLRAHWPSDVVAGVLFGFAVTTALAIAFRRADRDKAPAAKTAAAALLAVLVCVAAFGPAAYRTGLDRYRPAPTAQLVSMAAWRAGRVELPARRFDLEGHPEEAFTLIVTEPEGAFRARAERQGWRAAPALGLRSLTAMLDSSASLAAMPALPVLHDGKTPVLTLVRPVSDEQRNVLRLWTSGFRLQGTIPVEILVGSIVPETAHRTLGGITVFEAHDELSLPATGLTR